MENTLQFKTPQLWKEHEGKAHTKEDLIENVTSEVQKTESDNHLFDQIGLVVKEIREEKGLTQRQFCEVTGLRQAQLSLIETNRYALTFEQILTICNSLGIHPMVFTLKFFNKNVEKDMRINLSTDEFEPIIADVERLVKERKRQILEEEMEKLSAE